MVWLCRMSYGINGPWFRKVFINYTRTTEMCFACKKCKKVFRKDLTKFDEEDEYCPGCDNHYYLPAETDEKDLIKEIYWVIIIALFILNFSELFIIIS